MKHGGHRVLWWEDGAGWQLFAWSCPLCAVDSFLRAAKVKASSDRPASLEGA